MDPREGLRGGEKDRGLVDPSLEERLCDGDSVRLERLVSDVGGFLGIILALSRRGNAYECI